MPETINPNFTNKRDRILTLQESDFLMREWRFNSLLYTQCYPWHHSFFNRNCYHLENALHVINPYWYQHIWDNFEKETNSYAC